MPHLAQRIIRPLTAFAHDLTQGMRKRPRAENREHLKFIRGLPCLVPGCSRRDVEAAHIRMSNLQFGKRSTGMSEKPSDIWSVPLCLGHHRTQHHMGEEQFWAWVQVDPCQVAAALALADDDEERAEAIIREAKRR